MGSIDRSAAMEFLSQAECHQLLADHHVGRLGVTTHTGPEIYPVNYALDGEAIVFRTDPGGKLAALADHPTVCFEIDHVDTEARTGWSVLVKGTAHELGPHDQSRFVHLDLWAVGPKDHWVRIEPTEVTGRRIWQAALPHPYDDGIEVLDPAFVRPDR